MANRLVKRLWLSSNKNWKHVFKKILISSRLLLITSMLVVITYMITNLFASPTESRRRSEKHLCKLIQFIRGMRSWNKRKKKWARSSRVPRTSSTSTKTNFIKIKIAFSKTMIRLLRSKNKQLRSSRKRWILNQILNFLSTKICNKKLTYIWIHQLINFRRNL